MAVISTVCPEYLKSVVSPEKPVKSRISTFFVAEAEVSGGGVDFVVVKRGGVETLEGSGPQDEPADVRAVPAAIAGAAEVAGAAPGTKVLTTALS